MPVGVPLHDALRIAHQHVSRVVVCGVHKGLHLHGTALAQLLRKVPRDDQPHLRLACVERMSDRGHIVDHAGDLKVLAGLEVLEQILALLAAVLVVDIDGQPLEIEADAVAEQQHERDRHDDDDTEAARVAQNLQQLFSGNGQQAREAHGLTSAAAPRVVVTDTNTSSRVGRIFSTRVTVTLCA